jgi:hypothetical protein
MTAKDFTDLIAWQRADELERFALDMITRPTAAAMSTSVDTAGNRGCRPRRFKGSKVQEFTGSLGSQVQGLA